MIRLSGTRQRVNHALKQADRPRWPLPVSLEAAQCRVGGSRLIPVDARIDRRGVGLLRRPRDGQEGAGRATGCSGAEEPGAWQARGQPADGTVLLRTQAMNSSSVSSAAAMARVITTASASLTGNEPPFR